MVACPHNCTTLSRVHHLQGVGVRDGKMNIGVRDTVVEVRTGRMLISALSMAVPMGYVALVVGDMVKDAADEETHVDWRIVWVITTVSSDSDTSVAVGHDSGAVLFNGAVGITYDGAVEFSDGTGDPVEATGAVPVGKIPVLFARSTEDVVAVNLPLRSASSFVKLTDEVGSPLDAVPTGNVIFTEGVGRPDDGADEPVVRSGMVMFVEGVGRPLDPVPAIRVELVEADGIVSEADPPVDSGMVVFAEGVGYSPGLVPPVDSGIVALVGAVGKPLDPVPTIDVEFAGIAGMVKEMVAPVDRGRLAFNGSVSVADSEG